MIDEAEIHRMANSADVEERKEAVNQLRNNFASFSDKDTAWSDLIWLTLHGDEDVRWIAAGALGPALSHISDKDTACSNLIRLTQDQDDNVRWRAAYALGPAFLHTPDKDAAWSALHRLTQDVYFVRVNAVGALGYAFSHIPDKDAAWSDLHRLTQDQVNEVRGSAAYVLGYVFSYIPDKATAWSDLIRLILDADSFVRRRATDALSYAFSAVPDRATAWSDLHRLTLDADSFVRGRATDALSYVFSAVPDKATAWSDLIRLTQDESKNVRWSAADALGSCFSAVPDKATAWSDLHRFAQDADKNVRWSAAGAIGSCFFAIPDKATAWSDLIRLTQDENSFVRGRATDAIGSAFSHIPDKATAWSDLIRLTQDGDEDVRMFAYHSLGSASIYKATTTEGEEKFRDELKKAIDYFEKSSRESDARSFNPARFCLPFYRSYYAVISEKQEAETEAAKYLVEAKKATGRSESRESLIKAVENLANALKEAQKPDFSEKQEHLKTCRQYCDHTAELADNARGKSPVAAAAIMRGIPIVGERVKEIIAEIQEKAREACQQAQGTPAEDIACGVNQEVQTWQISNQEEMPQKLENIIFSLKSKIPQNQENSLIYEKIEQIREESDVIKQYETLSSLIALIPTTIIHIGNNTTIKDVKLGDNSQMIVNGNDNTNTSEKVPDITHKSPKTSIFTKKSKK